MAKKVITKKARVSVLKKRWYNVEAPKIFNNVVFAETLAVDPKVLVGRGVNTSLANINKGMKKQNLEVKFKIVEVKGNDCKTELVSMNVSAQHVKRLVKRAKKRVDDSFVVETKDKVRVRLKPLLLVRETVQRGVLTELRKETQKYFVDLAKETELNELLNMVLGGEVQKNVKVLLKKVYPVQNVNMRAVVILKK